MNQEVMNAIIRALTRIIDSLGVTAAKKGLSFLVMLAVIIAEGGSIVYLIKENKNDRIELKAEMREIKAEHSDQLNDLRRQIASCDTERQILAVKVAELTVLVNRKLKR